MDKITLRRKVLEQEARIRALEEMVQSLAEAILFLRNWMGRVK